MTRKNGMLFFVGAVLIAGSLILTNRGFVLSQPGKGGIKIEGSPHYTVVETQGTNLLVTDNSTNTIYYYAIDKDAKIGDDLKLAASCDLTQVGKDVIKIKANK